MKLFKRTAKDADGVTASAQLTSAPAAKAAKNSPNALLPGVLAALVGIILAGALLWFGPLNSAYQQQLQQLSQAWGGGQATVLQKALQQLSADTQAAARNPQLLQALQSQDINQIRAAERNLTYWSGVVDAHLNARGQAVQDMGRSAPMNFAALDMLRRAENGQTPAPEAYKVGQRWLVYSAAPLRLSEGEPLHGTLLLAVDLERLLASLPVMPAEIGQIQLIQQFNNTAAQVLAQRGDAQGTAQAFSTGNPNWTVSFTPGPSLTNPVFSPSPGCWPWLVQLPASTCCRAACNVTCVTTCCNWVRCSRSCPPAKPSRRSA
jgi:phosphomannomutase / phosphoglucomutase